jgi:dehydrogenase/reductase SDR family protein 7
MIFQLNALGAISLTKEVAKAMTKRQIVQGGKRRKFAPRIVGVCSVASKVPAPGQATYAAAKSAYAAFLNSMRSEIADTGVKVVCVYPGPIATGTDGKERVIFRSRLSASSPGAQRVGAASPSSNAKRTQSPPSQSSPSTKGRMSVPFVTEEIIRSTIAGADELILAPPAIMFLASVVRFAPTLAYAILDLVGPRRASKADAGENIYDLSSRRRVKKSSSTM